MSSVQAKRVANGTLSASTVDIVSLTDPGFGVEVTNLTQNGNLWFTVSAPGGPCPVPSVGGTSGEWCAASVGTSAVKVRHAGQFGSIVQLISGQAVSYSVAVVGARVDT